MLVLATISDTRRLALLLDARSGAVRSLPVQPEFFDPDVVGRTSCRPFGITWNSGRLYVTNNRQLLVFDAALTYRGTMPTRLQVNTHQLAYRDGRVWAVSPWTNSLIGVTVAGSQADLELNLLDQTVTVYSPRMASEDQDAWHFNSVLWADGRLYVAAHAFGAKSFVISHDDETFELVGGHAEVGSSIHGLALCEGELFWLSTGTEEIRSSRGYVLGLSRKGYARGFAMTPDYFIVAISEYLSRREERSGGDSWIQVIDRHARCTMTEFHLRDTGSINDLRLLDEFDYAHHVEPFW